VLRYIRARIDATRRKRIIESSGLFDANFYYRSYPDVGNAGWDALSHFAEHGLHELRKPSAWFDPQLYLQLHPDVAAAKVNPLLHYIQHGRAEGRQCASSEQPIASFGGPALEQLASDVMALARRQQILEQHSDEAERSVAAIRDAINKLDSRLQHVEKNKARE